MRTFSIVTRINIALACIVTLALSTMMVSYWLSDKADSDAHAVNVAGSLRMQSYRLAWLTLQQDVTKLQRANEQFASSWQHPVFQRFLHQPDILQKYQSAFQHWQQLAPALESGAVPPAELEAGLAEQVRLLDELVLVIQQDAEQKVKAFRSVQVIAVMATILLSIIVMYWLKVMVEEPLKELIRGARRIAQGDFTHRITPQHQDELGMLATSFNKMNTAIGYMYGNLEKRVEEQTAELTQTNTTLKFLYNTAQRISEHTSEYQDFSEIISQLRSITGLADIELCLFTEQGNQPYLQIHADSLADPCAAENCGDCLTETLSRQQCQVHNFVLQRERHKYGVLVVRLNASEKMLLWQQQLVMAIADQLALALSLKSEEEQVRRLALMQERTVIARELHDSLAQALSYLKIQVTRLNKAINKDDRLVMQDVSAELKSGLDAAYRQLRELLTTFRLKVDGAGLLSALQTTVSQLSEQSGLQIRLDYQLANVPLAPHEEIHLLQIIREASQNAVHHSQGQNLTISLQQDGQKYILLAVEDDGVGIPDKAEKLNHYGLAIIQERSKHLAGEISIRRRSEGGTGVYFRFLPEYLQQPKTA
ncbi:type IV pili methyl-accepting chemotaxis transducer N-terminal domain-containing protein [Alishewanella sp. BS5-314]|uniref:ATP-binding protein n=1 Tax=Alishewanella sp. BS5-314 TaxID=2755587 RepID=UPI0021BAB4FB|nr:ATP-binding protein [Alishewanella sp. BS5-314]MCT8124960.1 type IV pili methyl-accepting chemotaxis transducer N-terminal domain-containing protein [Alishewanella sp. BS5-314]